MYNKCTASLCCLLYITQEEATPVPKEDQFNAKTTLILVRFHSFIRCLYHLIIYIIEIHLPVRSNLMQRLFSSMVFNVRWIIAIRFRDIECDYISGNSWIALLNGTFSICYADQISQRARCVYSNFSMWVYILNHNFRIKSRIFGPFNWTNNSKYMSEDHRCLVNVDERGWISTIIERRELF